METLQTASREDTGPLKKPLKEHFESDDHRETNYVDLGNPSDMKSDSTKTVKVTFTGEGNQLAIFKCKGDTTISGNKSPGEREETGNPDKPSSCHSEGLHEKRAPLIDDYVDAGSEVKSENLKSTSCETEELQYTDMYLNSRCESKDNTSVADVESHYITTHEIQLTELDHDVDYEFGRGSCWDFEDDNLVYSFVDYASFDSDETTLGRIRSKSKSNKVPPTLRAAKLSATGALVSTESELCESDKCASSDEGTGQRGHIHLSIKTSSRAVNEPAGVLGQRNVRFHTRRAGERSHYSFKSSDSKSETLFDRYFIPPPGRQHLASKLRGKDINEYSSGASSSVSELDDADKEVRNLTARSFRSLACPYFDAINLSSSSESSVSEHGLSINKWSAFVDLNYGNLTREAHKNSTPVMEGNKTTECTNINDVVQPNTPSPQTKIVSLKNNLNSQQASKKIELRSKPGETITLTETLNFNCNVGAGIPARERRAKRALNAVMSRSTADVTGTTPAKAGCEAESPFGESSEDVHKKAIFASSLLKNVISKKMQFEQERKMERGEITDLYPVPSVCKETVRNLQRQFSDSTSGHSQEELVDATDQLQENPCSPAAEIPESPCDPEMTSKSDPSEPLKAPFQKSAFKTWKDEEQEAQDDGESQCAPEEELPSPDTSIRPVTESTESVEGESSKMIKMSHLYVPSSQLMPKEKEAAGLSLHNLKVTGDLAESDGGGCGKLSSGQLRSPVDTDLKEPQSSQCQKAPEIKIHLRSVKENKSNQFNITNLLTPNIHPNTNAKKATNESKSNLLTVSDKVPHFMVRDIRDSKCKFQTPIHQVRDVRKLVKSSYRFVALENASSTALREESKPVNRGPDKKAIPTPMVIKCQSVNTNNAAKPSEPVGETARSSPNLSEGPTKSETLRAAPRVPCPKQPVSEHPEFSLKIDAKASKQKPEKSTEGSEKKPESKVSNQIALEKLKAAVKTMEQLYVFDRNEWKRKTQAPRPITDSHVLSLITREEQGVTTKTDLENEYGKADTSSQLHAEKLTSSLGVDEDKMCMPTGQEDTAKLVTQRADSFTDKCVFSQGSNLKGPTRTTPTNDGAPQMLSTLQSHKAPVSLKICPSKSKSEEKHQKEHQQADSDNYLTIPVKAHASDSKPSQTVGSHPKPSHQPLQRSPIVMESWSPDSQTATIYHHAMPLPAVPAPQPQLLCLTPPADIPPPHIQRKLLLDPSTGQYYLVDTPVPMQPAAQRFYHPETGQYLDIPLPLTPVPVSVSPVALGPAAAYPPTYLVYPSTLMPSHPHPVPQSHSSTCSEGDDVVETGSMYLIPQGTAVPSSNTKPVISITSQQGARIVAPPSFDGTTMSFVVEHR